MRPGTPARATHDYVRPGTSSLYATMDLATGEVIGSLHARHRAIEFKKFLVKLDGEVPAVLDVHVVLDNASIHKTPAVRRWLLAHPRFVLHFTLTSSSWLNLVERWFGELTIKKLQRGTHRSVHALNTDIRTWIESWNDNHDPTSGPKPPTRSLNPSLATAYELTTQDTRDRRAARRRNVAPGPGDQCRRCLLLLPRRATAPAVGGWIVNVGSVSGLGGDWVLVALQHIDGCGHQSDERDGPRPRGRGATGQRRTPVAGCYRHGGSAPGTDGRPQQTSWNGWRCATPRSPRTSRVSSPFWPATTHPA